MTKDKDRSNNGSKKAFYKNNAFRGFLLPLQQLFLHFS